MEQESKKEKGLEKYITIINRQIEFAWQNVLREVGSSMREAAKQKVIVADKEVHEEELKKVGNWAELKKEDLTNLCKTIERKVEERKKVITCELSRELVFLWSQQLFKRFSDVENKNLFSFAKDSFPYF